jgi:hypothetical protein
VQTNIISKQKTRKIVDAQISKMKNSSYAYNNRMIIATTTSTSNFERVNKNYCVLTVFSCKWNRIIIPITTSTSNYGKVNGRGCVSIVYRTLMPLKQILYRSAYPFKKICTPELPWQAVDILLFELLRPFATNLTSHRDGRYPVSPFTSDLGEIEIHRETRPTAKASFRLPNI